VIGDDRAPARRMPSDLEAEKSLLGAMLLDPRIVPAVVAEVPPLEW
jgi:replicative DNA helicase